MADIGSESYILIISAYKLSWSIALTIAQQLYPIRETTPRRPLHPVTRTTRSFSTVYELGILVRNGNETIGML
jgi:hypothetical protein